MKSFNLLDQGTVSVTILGQDSFIVKSIYCLKQELQKIWTEYNTHYTVTTL